jgi:sarcosine oxidase subunit alpha
MSAPATPLPTGRTLDPHAPVLFTFEGQPVRAAAGQSIGAALYASGIRIFTRSFKYHRPRGLFCVSGDCPHCLMTVDGRPNVRTCIEPAGAGQRVISQNCWPSLNHDVLRAFDRLDYFLPVGFYYKRFHKPRWLWPIFEHFVRHVAGLGRIDVKAKPKLDANVEHLHTDVCVIGAGPAGLSAASAAADAGASVLVLEREIQVGGHLLYEGDPQSLLGSLRSAAGKAELLLGATVFGIYEGNLIGAAQGQRLLKIRAKQIIVCTGGRQRPFLFHNNDLPGIMLARGVLRLSRSYGVRAGHRAVVLTDHDDGYRLAQQISELGIAIAAVVDTRPGTGSAPNGRWPVLAGHCLVRAFGNSALKAVRVQRGDGTGPAQDIDCDLLCQASRLVPANELLHQAGTRFRYEEGRWLPGRAVPGILAAGAAAGTFALDAQIAEGKRRGAEAAQAGVGSGQPTVGSEHAAAAPVGVASGLTTQCPLPTGKKQFVCLCEDVTEKDIEQAIAEGFDSIEPLKRYSTVSMGPCQGKMCGQTASELCAHFNRCEVGAVGTTTNRPPLVPVEMAVLASDRRHHPVRRTPLHHWHKAQGARWLDAGQWKRPESYGDPVAEVKTVRNGVGLIDVSTLGKIEIVGPQAAELLDRVCLQKWAGLKPGRVRYSVMCTEEGILFDDGIGACLESGRYYLTASTGNAEAVFQWLELWRTTWRLDATVLNRTSGLAAMNLAGPQTREVLGKVTSLDLSSAAFPYPAVREGEVAGVPCRLLRIGFVGELGYEIHCPSAYTWHVWTALLEAGKGFGIKPFGVEAQRIMRLEKGHLIVGQDTDALSNPLEAGLDGLVRFDKPQFLGQQPLVRLKERPPRSRLVGFELSATQAGLTVGPQALEGCQVVEQGRPAGRVTSCRFSPTLSKYIGLAWVPVALSAPTQRFAVRFSGADVMATVASLPFYDPEGKRLKV